MNQRLSIRDQPKAEQNGQENGRPSQHKVATNCFFLDQFGSQLFFFRQFIQSELRILLRGFRFRLRGFRFHWLLLGVRSR